MYQPPAICRISQPIVATNDAGDQRLRLHRVGGEQAEDGAKTTRFSAVAIASPATSPPAPRKSAPPRGEPGDDGGDDREAAEDDQQADRPAGVSRRSRVRPSWGCPSSD